jgi:hypothetical protein
MSSKRELLLLATFFLTFVFFVGFVSATVTLVTPATSGTVTSNTTTMNATNSSSFGYPVNCTFWAQSTSTANSSYVAVGTFTNYTAGALFINGTLNSTYLEDSNDYQFKASCWNISGVTQENSSATTGITVENTVPTAPTATPADKSTDTDGSITFTGTVVGRETTGCTLFFTDKNPGSKSYSMTHSGSSCTYALTGIPEQTYSWIIQASDGTNNTNMSKGINRSIRYSTRRWWRIKQYSLDYPNCYCGGCVYCSTKK